MNTDVVRTPPASTPIPQGRAGWPNVNIEVLGRSGILDMAKVRSTRTKSTDMGTERGQIMVDGIPVEVVRKRVKHLRLTVSAPEGRVRVSVPLHVDDAAVRAMVGGRLGWIRRHQARLAGVEAPAVLRIVTGERHRVGGASYELRVVEQRGAPGVEIDGGTLVLRVRPGSDRARRLAVLESWLRERLRGQVAELVAAWEPRIGVTVGGVGIRKMTTRWGSCNVRAGRIWLNLELARRPPGCVEYVVVHEMVHLLERRHDGRFYGFMDQLLPDWRRRRDELNGAGRIA